MIAEALVALTLATCAPGDLRVSFLEEGVAGGRVVGVLVMNVGRARCRLHTRVELRIALTPIRGNAAKASVNRVLQRRATTTVAWVWRNWCRDAHKAFVGARVPAARWSGSEAVEPPLCANPHARSTLRRAA